MNTNINIFEQATRQRIRFETGRGLVSIEEVWGMPLKHDHRYSLDDLGRALLTEQKEAERKSTASLVDDTADSTEDSTLELRLALVKHVIGVKKAEEAARKNEKAARQNRRDLLDLLHNAENAERANWTPDQIKAKIAELDQQLGAESEVAGE